MGYRGPRFGFSPMPDQYALQALQKDELATTTRRPVFSEVFLSSSHEPWTRIPRLIAWHRVGNGSIFNRLPVDRTGLTDAQQGYTRSLQYSLRTIYSFVERHGSARAARARQRGDGECGKALSRERQSAPRRHLSARAQMKLSSPQAGPKLTI